MIVNADARAIPLADASVHCVVTSPPYWGLRDYGNGRWVGGLASCAHRGRQHYRFSDKQATNPHGKPPTAVCVCGATRTDAGIGLEASFDEWLDNLVAVFREVRRVLRDDGTVWLNIGDAYCAARGGGQGQNGAIADRSAAKQRIRERNEDRFVTGLKPKDLIGAPWRAAFALQADGWYLRADIVWAKSNPMPESVIDRPTRSHEFVFLLSKRRRYFYDADAVREPSTSSPSDVRKMLELRARIGGKAIGNEDALNAASVRTKVGRQRSVGDPRRGRNLRDVWTITGEGFSGAHFATFPTRLVEPCIKAGSPVGGGVLDPFAGSGTVGVVAARLNRRFVGLELNAEYCAMAERRIALATRSGAEPSTPVEVGQAALW